MIHADEQGSMVGYEDVHTRIDICRGHYESAAGRPLRRSVHPI